MKYFILFLAIILSVQFANAQEINAPAEPEHLKWGVGIELGDALYRLLPDPRPSLAIGQGQLFEVEGLYNYRANRSWRIGYEFYRSTHQYTGTGFVEGVLRNVHNDLRADRHGFTLGHQWTFCTSRIRPVIGLEATFLSYRYRGDRNWSELVAGNTTSSPWTFSEIERFNMLSFSGNALAGLQFQAHKHLLIELRLSSGYYLSTITTTNQPGAEPLEGFRVSSVGSGLYARFLF